MTVKLSVSVGQSFCKHAPTILSNIYLHCLSSAAVYWDYRTAEAPESIIVLSHSKVKGKAYKKTPILNLSYIHY